MLPRDLCGQLLGASPAPLRTASWFFPGTFGQLAGASLEKTAIKTWPKTVIFKAKWL